MTPAPNTATLRERVFAALALQQLRRLAGDAGAGGAERMADGDGAAVEVDLALVQAEVAKHRQRLG